MSSPRLIIVGSSGHAAVVVDVAHALKDMTVIGFTDSFRVPGERIHGLEILGSPEDLGILAERFRATHVFVAVGDNFHREKMTAKARAQAPDLVFATLVHPRSIVSYSSHLGAGSVILPGAVIGPHATIGEGCIVNTHASLDHDGIMGEFSSLGPGVHTGGNVRVGRGSAIGIGATLIHSVTVGEHTVVGAGATVLENLPDQVVAYGSPARVIRARSPGDKYL